MTHERVKAAISLPSITGLRRFRIAPSIAALSIVIPAVAQETPAAVQWRVEDGGNGHWYAFRLEPMSASMNCWSSAVEHARAQGGDLLALSSLDEEAFVVAALCDDAPLSSIDGQHYYGWIGFTGTGHWSNGEPETYIHWGNSGPSGDGPHVRMRGLDCQVYGWNDIGGSDGCHPTGADALYYTMEWEADCNGDGIVDYGQILDGTFDDANDNGVPDCCDAGDDCDPVDVGPIQWRIEDGGNGHWYELEIITETFCPRDNYVPAARIRGADPISIQSLEENEFVLELIPTFHPAYSTAVLGCVRDAGTGWRWLSGDDWTFENWIYGQGQTQSEPTASIYAESSPYGPGWHDYPGECHAVSSSAPTSLIFEWSADCNGDGIVDYGQILDGTFDDVDDNGVPDCCDAGVSCDTPCPADLSEDGVVNPIDLGLLLTFWGTDGQNNPQADIDGDGYVGPTDLGLLLGAWGACPER